MDLRCPFCRRPMTKGTLRSAGGKPADGPYFCPPDGERTNVSKYTSNEAFQCEDCCTVVIRGRFADDDEVPPDGAKP
jgi:hypothetical protein